MYKVFFIFLFEFYTMPKGCRIAAAYRPQGGIQRKAGTTAGHSTTADSPANTLSKYPITKSSNSLLFLPHPESATHTVPGGAGNGG